MQQIEIQQWIIDKALFSVLTLIIAFEVGFWQKFRVFVQGSFVASVVLTDVCVVSETH